MRSFDSLNCLALSERINFGVPLRAVNRLNASMNFAVVASVTNSKWTARVVKHANITP